MKFIISENRLKDLKNKLVKHKMNYLDSYVGDVSKTRDFIILWGDKIEFEDNHEILFEYDYYDGRLYVNKELRHTFSSMFGDNREESDVIFKRWFENKFGVEVKFLD